MASILNVLSAGKFLYLAEHDDLVQKECEKKFRLRVICLSQIDLPG